MRELDDDAQNNIVTKVSKDESEYFNTLSENAPNSNLIRAIIDEEVKAVEGSRVRLRLLDAIDINGTQLPKGSYLYATMSGFGQQRMQGNMNLNQTSGGTSVSQWAGQALQNAYQKTSNAISKAIKKNRVRLKYGTQVFLVNSKQQRKR